MDSRRLLLPPPQIASQDSIPAEDTRASILPKITIPITGSVDFLSTLFSLQSILGSLQHAIMCICITDRVRDSHSWFSVLFLLSFLHGWVSLAATVIPAPIVVPASQFL